MINISKPRKMDNKDYEKLLGTYMTPLSDEDRVSFKLKNGKIVSGENMLQYKDVEVELIDDSRISNIDLKKIFKRITMKRVFISIFACLLLSMGSSYFFRI